MWEVGRERAVPCMCLRRWGRNCVWIHGMWGWPLKFAIPRCGDFYFFFFLKHRFRWSTGEPAFVPVPPSSARQPSWPAHSTSPASCPRLQNLAGQGGEETHRVSFTPQGHQARNPGKKVNLSPIKRSVLKNTFFPSLSF